MPGGNPSQEQIPTAAEAEAARPQKAHDINRMNGPGGAKRKAAISAGLLAKKINDREQSRPWPAARGAQMRYVFSQTHVQDLTPAEKNYRRWFLKDAAGYMAEMERLEAAEAAGAVEPHRETPAAPAAPEKPEPDPVGRQLTELIGELLGQARERAGRAA